MSLPSLTSQEKGKTRRGKKNVPRQALGYPGDTSKYKRTSRGASDKLGRILETKKRPFCSPFHPPLLANRCGRSAHISRGQLQQQWPHPFAFRTDFLLPHWAIHHPGRRRIERAKKGSRSTVKMPEAAEDGISSGGRRKGESGRPRYAPSSPRVLPIQQERSLENVKPTQNLT